MSGALQGFNDALDQLDRAKSATVDALSSELDAALAKFEQEDVSTAETLFATIKRLRPTEPRLAHWQVKLVGLGIGQQGSAKGPQVAKPSGKVITNSIGMELIPIPAGEFLMGSRDDGSSRADEQPQHRVHISQSFYLGRHEVTQGQYKEVTGRDPSKFKGKNLPVEQVTANEAEEFCRLLSEREQRAGLLAAAEIYRLPAEAEWEYAARAGTSTRWFCGDNEQQLGSFARYQINAFSITQEVGKKLPNPWGLYDMAGNVSEWVLDEHRSYAYTGRADKVTVDPLVRATESGHRVIRGGSWNHKAQGCRSAFRDWAGVNFPSSTVGFRVVKGPPVGVQPRDATEKQVMDEPSTSTPSSSPTPATTSATESISSSTSADRFEAGPTASPALRRHCQTRARSFPFQSCPRGPGKLMPMRPRTS